MKSRAVTFALVLLGCCGQVSAQPAPLPQPATKPAAPTSVSGVKPATSGKVWGALIYATDGKPVGMPASVPADLKDLPKRLGKVFKYSRFEVLGDHSQDIFPQDECWVVPSKEFFLKLGSKGPATGGGLKLDLQFWRLNKVLVKTDALLRPHSPLFVRGPKWRDGQLIFVLLLTEGGRKK